MIVAPNSPVPRAQASAEPAPSPVAESGTATRQNVRAGLAPERAGGVDQRTVDGLERGDRLADVERRCDERDGEDDRGLRERDLDPEGVELLAEEPASAEEREQRDPGHRRREDQRQLDERDQDTAAAEALRGQEVGGRRADEQHEEVGDQAGLQAHPERVERHVARQRVEQLAGRDAEEERENGEEEERERESGRDRQRDVEDPPHGGPKPASASASWPSSPSTRSTNSCAASAFSESTTTAIGYWTTACASSGQLDRLDVVAGRGRVGHVDEARVSGPGGDLADDALHVLLVRDDVLEHVGHAHVLEHGARVVADRHSLGADDQLDAVGHEVLDGLDPGRVVGRDD